MWYALHLFALVLYWQSFTNADINSSKSSKYYKHPSFLVLVVGSTVTGIQYANLYVLDLCTLFSAHHFWLSRLGTHHNLEREIRIVVPGCFGGPITGISLCNFRIANIKLAGNVCCNLKSCPRSDFFFLPIMCCRIYWFSNIDNPSNLVSGPPS